LWLLVGLVAVAIRRPRGSLVALALAAAALLVLLLDAAAVYAVAEFAVPVVPAFVVLAAVGLVGRRDAGGAGEPGTVPAR
jgi:CHASE2 domain-containing sensor protein